MARSQTSIHLDPGDEFSTDVLVDSAVVRLSPRHVVHCADPDQLERLGEACLEAARDLRAVAARSAA